jgi:hypothetical protein
MNMRIGLGIGLPCGGWRSSAWTPASLFAASEAGAWYDPSDLATIWQDSSRTTAGAVDSPVGALDDKSGNGHHLTQATADARPILRQSGGMYYLERDGSDDRMATGTVFTLQAGWTLAAAARFTAGADTQSRGILALTQTGNVTNYFMLGMRQSVEAGRSALRGANASPAVSLTTVNAATNSYPAATPAVIVSRFQALSHDFRLNGTTLGSVATTWDAQTVADEQLVFGNQTQTADPVPANLYAAVALQRIPSADELANLEAWLAGKSGVTL